jgi:hypothetical protein
MITLSKIICQAEHHQITANPRGVCVSTTTNTSHTLHIPLDFVPHPAPDETLCSKNDEATMKEAVDSQTMGDLSSIPPSTN